MKILLLSPVWKLMTAGACLCFVAIVLAPIGCTQRERDPSFQQGQEIFRADCIACHGPNGSGVLYSKSALNNSAFVTGNPEEVIAVILFGRTGSGSMPGWQTKLTDQEVAAVATYIRQAWSNQADPVTAALVTKVRTKEEKSLPTEPLQK